MSAQTIDRSHHRPKVLLSESLGELMPDGPNPFVRPIWLIASELGLTPGEWPQKIRRTRPNIRARAAEAIGAPTPRQSAEVWTKALQIRSADGAEVLGYIYERRTRRGGIEEMRVTNG